MDRDQGWDSFVNSTSIPLRPGSSYTWGSCCLPRPPPAASPTTARTPPAVAPKESVGSNDSPTASDHGGNLGCPSGGWLRFLSFFFFLFYLRYF